MKSDMKPSLIILMIVQGVLLVAGISSICTEENVSEWLFFTGFNAFFLLINAIHFIALCDGK